MGKRKKSSASNVIKEEDSKVNENTPSDSNKTPQNNNLSKNTASNIRSKSKKIVFVDDIPQEVDIKTAETPDVSKTHKKSKKDNDTPHQNEGKESESPKNKKQQQQPTPDDEVKDEDIDKFCDELTEDDNVQYENWIKLIEEKLKK